MKTSAMSLIMAALAIAVAGCGDGVTSGQPPTPKGTANVFDPNDPQFKQRVQARLEEMQREEAVRESAPWFGTTGLAESDERELPRYLRREFGEPLSAPGSLKASDLHYEGVFTQGAETVHYWRINYGSPEPKFAYVVVAPPGHEVMAWGDREPPK